MSTTTPAEDRLVELMANLERSVREAKAERDRLRAERGHPATGTRVAVTFPGNEWHDGDVVTGTVTAHYADGFDVVRDDDGESFTLFDIELADDRCTLEAITDG